MMRIIIWDNHPARIAEIDKNLHLALQHLGIRAIVTSNTEPPLLARENILGRLPVLEIDGYFWFRKPGEAFSEKGCALLLQRVIRRTDRSYG